MSLATPLPARLVQAIGKLSEIHVYWGTCPAVQPDAHGLAYHEAWKRRPYMGASAERAPAASWAVLEDEWPTACDACGTDVPRGAYRTAHAVPIYETETGKPEPGDLYWQACHGARSGCAWDNCPGTHLVGVCPNGFHWDLDYRASNCTRREDRQHRCWVRHGQAPAVHVDKAGVTCAAGAGGIDAPGVKAGPGWHGFLDHGVWTTSRRP